MIHPIAAASIVLFALNVVLNVLLARMRRKKERTYGVVYNNHTHRPVDLASVRLLDPLTGRTLQTQVTDALGRYSMMVPAGKYHVDVRKVGIVFPSALDISPDPAFRDVLRGNEIVLSGGTFAQDIPVDPVTAERPPLRMLFLRYARYGQQGLAVAAAILALIAAVLSTTVPMVALVAVQAVAFVVFRRLSLQTNAKTFGVIRDEKGKPVAQAMVRLFESKYNKLLESRVTAEGGKYGFLVHRGDYNLTVEAKTFAPWKEQVKADIDGYRVVRDVTLSAESPRTA